MKYIIILASVFFYCQAIIAQQSQAYKLMIQKLVPVDSSVNEVKFKNGNLKEKGKTLIYNTEDVTCEFYTGKMIQYYGSGPKLYEYVFDDYGNQMSFKFFDVDGNLKKESMTISMDTKAKNPKEFLLRDRKIILTTIETKYKCSKNCQWYKFKEGKRKNGKKIGLWKTYSESGEVINEKSY